MRPNSLMYRYIYRRFFAWRHEKEGISGRLTEKQIRIYAAMAIAIGVFIVVTGLIVIVSS